MDPDVSRTLAGRDIALPAEDEVPVTEYWRKMRGLRARVDESRLADHEIAVTWNPAEEVPRG